jgi:hypothetical protein
MADDVFTGNLGRWTAAEVHLLNVQTAARDLFGKGYVSLSESKRRLVENAVWPVVQQLARWATPQGLADWAGDEVGQQRRGFGFPTAPANPERT